MARGAAMAAMILGLLSVLDATPTAAQGLSLMGGEEGPLEIDASDGIEWQRQERRYVAKGDARAFRNGVELLADRLIAYYRESETGDSEIWRIDADGSVVVRSDTERVQGDKGKYDLDQGVVVLTGSDLKLTTPTDTITAQDSLEYWERRLVAVARGDARVLSGTRTIRGEVLQAHFREGAEGDLNARLVEGFNDVCLQNNANIARGARGDYNLETGMAFLRENVRVSQGENILVGREAEVNMNTGVSRVLSGGNQRVRVRIPNAGGGQEETDQPAAPTRTALPPCL